MHRLLITCSAVLVGFTMTSCSSSSTRSLSCSTTEVSPSTQPGKPNARAALDWYVGHQAKAAGLPTTGYRLESHSVGRYVFVSGTSRISVSSLPTIAKGTPRTWVVLVSYSC